MTKYVSLMTLIASLGLSSYIQGMEWQSNPYASPHISQKKSKPEEKVIYGNTEPVQHDPFITATGEEKYKLSPVIEPSKREPYANKPPFSQYQNPPTQRHSNYGPTWGFKEQSGTSPAKSKSEVAQIFVENQTPNYMQVYFYKQPKHKKEKTLLGFTKKEKEFDIETTRLAPKESQVIDLMPADIQHDIMVKVYNLGPNLRGLLSDEERKQREQTQKREKKKPILVEKEILKDITHGKRYIIHFIKDATGTERLKFLSETELKMHKK